MKSKKYHTWELYIILGSYISYLGVIMLAAIIRLNQVLGMSSIILGKSADISYFCAS
mgnify:CR=1 FL=1